MTAGFLISSVSGGVPVFAETVEMTETADMAEVVDMTESGEVTEPVDMAEAADTTEIVDMAQTEDAPEASVIDLPELGFYFVYPETYREENLKGIVDWRIEYPDTGILRFAPYYYAVSMDRLDDYLYCLENGLEDKTGFSQEPDPSWLTGYEYGSLFEVYAINDGRGEEQLRDYLKINDFREDNFSWLEEIGSDGDTTFFLGQYAQPEEEKEIYREHMGDFYDEFVSLYEDKDSFHSALTLSAPQWPHVTAAGDVISFETTDLDGNSITSAEIFGGHKVTMVNIWATWCGPCTAELPELGELAEEFETRGCQIVGLCHDAGEEGKAQEAKTILSEAGADYLNIIAPDNFDDVFMIEAFPTSFFIGSDGTILTDPVVGAYPDQYPEVLAEALALAE